MNQTVKSRFEAEVVELHDFFEAWLGGALPRTEAEFARFQTTIARSTHSYAGYTWVTSGSSPLTSSINMISRRPDVQR